uniref:Uncharacterized protein n=1 Tax=Panstrongylus lignarius TaxID=156445 RepID=A0A224XCW4_9HEMI
MYSSKIFVTILALIIYVRPSYEKKNYTRKIISTDIVNNIIDNVITAYKNKFLHYLTESYNEMMSAKENSTSNRRFPHQLHKVEEFDYHFFVIEQHFNRIMNESSVDWNSDSKNYLDPQEIKDESQKVTDGAIKNWKEVWHSKWTKLRKEMNPTNLVQTFSLFNATKDMSKLIKQHFGRVKHKKQSLKPKRIQYTVEQLESILDKSVVKNFKLKQNDFFAKLFDLIKQRRKNTENFDKLYKEVKRILEYSRNIWLNKWITMKSLLKSDPEKLPPPVEIESLVEQPIVTVLDRKLSQKLLKKYKKQVDQLHQLNHIYRTIVIAKLTADHPQLLQPLSAGLNENQQPSESGSERAKSNVFIRQLVYNYRQKIMKIVHDSIEKLSSLWFHSLQKGVSNVDFKQFYNNVNKEIKRLIKQIDLDATLHDHLSFN